MGRPRADGLSTLTIPVTEKFVVQVEKAARRAKMKMPDFVCKAIEEKIERGEKQSVETLPWWASDDLGVD